MRISEPISELNAARGPLQYVAVATVLEIRFALNAGMASFLQELHEIGIALIAMLA